MGRWSGVLVVSLALASCGGDNTAPSTTSTSTSSAISTTTVATTTTQSPEVPMEGPVIIERGQRWDVGVEHLTGAFLPPIRFVIDTEGWSNSVATNRVFLVLFDEDNDGQDDVSIAFVRFSPELEANELLDAIGQLNDRIDVNNSVSAISDRDPIELAGLAAVAQSFEAPPSSLRGVNRESSQHECASPPGRAVTSFGLIYRLPRLHAPSVSTTVGLPSCAKSRVWVFDVDGERITAIGTTRHQDRFDEWMTFLEDFLNTSVTFGAGDG